jgi:hypothetical protein
MHDVEQRAPARKSNRKPRDRARFEWHEKLITTEAELMPAAYRLAAWMMHDTGFKFTDHGYVELSLRTAMKHLRLSKGSAVRARQELERRGWLVRVPGASARSTARYLLGDGPTLMTLLRMGRGGPLAGPGVVR